MNGQIYPYVDYYAAIKGVKYRCVLPHGLPLKILCWIKVTRVPCCHDSICMKYLEKEIHGSRKQIVGYRIQGEMGRNG